MSYVLSDDLWAPQARGLKQTIDFLDEGKSVLLYGPTGCGKTRMAIELIRWAAYHKMGANFYVNRTLLVGQTSERFSALGIHHGVRAANYDDRYDLDAMVQICSADTEASRVLKRETWPFAPAGLIIVDEAHLQKTQAMDEILAHYKGTGACVVLLTATPVEMGKWADEIVISGTMQEYRDCGALVPAVVKSISAPDLKDVKRNQTGEFILDGQKKKIFTQSIVGDVLSRWKKYNPDARPTMLYSPGVAESVWFTEQFEKMGVRWCHVDAVDAVLDGKRYKLNRKLWEEIQEQYKDGSIKGMSCKFKLREGIDIPQTYHCILATPIGSVASYIQTVGRVLRAAPGKDHAIVTDHGGCYLNHGSPNHDRPWEILWKMKEHVASKLHREAVKEGKRPESIVCPVCETERAFGPKCPSCGFEHSKGSRKVIMTDGKLKTVEGKLIPLRHRTVKPDTKKLWEKMFWGFRKKKLEKSFSQLEAFFVHTYGYWPSRDLPLMPKYDYDWKMPVFEVPMEDLRS